MTGNIIRHRPFLQFEQPDFTYGMEYEYKTKTDTSSSWRTFWRYPELTHHFHFTNFNNKEELGFALAYFPSLSFKIFGGQRFQLRYKMGTGISRISKPFHLTDNPANNAIGSFLNGVIMIRLESKIRISDQWYLSVSPQFTHYSNGATKSPNAGINIPSLVLGIRKELGQNIEWKKGPMFNSPTRWKRWQYELSFGLGFKQINIPNSLNYRIPQVNFMVHFHPLEFFRIVGGISYEYNYATYYFLRHQFYEKSDAQKEARSYNLKLSGDLIFGNFFARLQVGQNVNLENKEMPSHFSSMLSLNYVPFMRFSQKQKMFVGVGIRSHKFVAQYLSVNTGIIF